MMAAAAATTELKVGCLVFDNDYKHPVVLAKEIATIDHLSGGRVELGIGAGWMLSDYDESGIPHDPAGVRVDRMAEGITAMKALFADEPANFSGEHYTITNHNALPKPVQRPHPPFLIGGGRKRVLSIAAREAQIVGINPSMHEGVIGPGAIATATAAATDEKLGWIRDAAGDRFDELELNMLVIGVVPSDDVEASAAEMGALFGISGEEALDVPHMWLGDTDRICDVLHERRERWGVSYYVVQSDTIEAVAPIVAKLTGQ